MSTTVRLGKVRFTPRGLYNAATEYAHLDVVAYGTGAYVALRDVCGVTPSDDGVNYSMLCAGGGMNVSIYDPMGVEADAFDFENLHSTPTTLGGYGITDAVAKSGTVTSFSASDEDLTPGTSPLATGEVRFVYE